MYRIFCESYDNFINSFNETSYRLKIAKPLELIVNIDKYKEEKKQSENFKKLCNLFYERKCRKISKSKGIFMDFKFKKYEWKKI